MDTEITEKSIRTDIAQTLTASAKAQAQANIGLSGTFVTPSSITSSASAGAAGSWSYDGTYLYAWQAAAGWKRLGNGSATWSTF